MKKVLFILCGILFVGVGIFILISGNAKIKRCTEKTVGTVVDIKEEWSTDSEGEHTYKYYPVIRYQAEGRTITKQSNISSSSNSKLSLGGGFTLSSTHSMYRVNDNISVFYNPDDVEEFIIEGEKNNNFIGGIICIILGSLAAIFGIIKPVY